MLGIAIVLTGTAWGAPTPAAAESATRAFDIPAETAETALRSFVEQADTQFVYSADKVKGVRTNALKGNYAPREALDRLVSGTELFVVQDARTGALTVDRNRSGAVPQNSPKPPNEAKMKTHKQTHKTLLGWLAALFVATSSASVSAQEATAGYGQAAPQPSLPAAAPAAPGAEIVKLPQFSVTAYRADQYNSPDASSFARTASKILDTALTVYVITPAMIQDISPNSLFNVTNYYPGVSPGRATGVAGFNDRMTFRGMESYSRSVDNFSSALLTWGYGVDNALPVFVDHAELIMGPDAILNPTGTPGGTINAITKSPQFTQGTDVSAVVGNYNGNKVSVDSTGPLGDGKHMAYRLIAHYQDSPYYTPGSYRVQAASAQFTYTFSPTAKVTFKYFGNQNRLTGTVTMSNATGEMVYTPDTVRGVTISNDTQPGFIYNGWNGDAAWSYRLIRSNTGEAELTAALGERINMRLAAQVAYSNQYALEGYPSPVFTETWDTNTGVQIATSQIDPTNLPARAFVFKQTSRQIQVQNDYAGNFKVGGVSLQPLGGWAYTQGSIPVFYSVTDTNLPPINLAQKDYSPAIPPNSAFTINGYNTPENGWTLQAYGFLRAGFLNDRLFATVGAGRTWAKVNDYVLPYTIDSGAGINAGAPGPVVRKIFSNTGNPLRPSVQPWKDNYIAGLLGKVLPNVSVYYSYSTNAGIATNIPDWQAGVQNEFGIKSNFFKNRISVTVDHFEIKQNNVSYTNPLFSLGQSTIQTIYSDLRSHGEEFNIAGGITEDLSVIMSYTNQKLRDHFGRRMRNIPDNMANVLLNYRFDIFNKGALKKNASVFVGIIHQGEVAGENVTGFTALGVPRLPGYYVPAYTVVSVGGSYQLGNYRFNLNVDNALNKRCWWQAGSRSCLTPYPGICVTFTVTVHIK